MKVFHVVLYSGYIIILEERKNVFLHTKTVNRYGGREFLPKRKEVIKVEIIIK